VAIAAIFYASDQNRCFLHPQAPIQGKIHPHKSNKHGELLTSKNLIGISGAIFDREKYSVIRSDIMSGL
jgi:hypothetical protein